MAGLCIVLKYKSRNFESELLRQHAVSKNNSLFTISTQQRCYNAFPIILNIEIEHY